MSENESLEAERRRKLEEEVQAQLKKELEEMGIGEESDDSDLSDSALEYLGEVDENEPNATATDEESGTEASNTPIAEPVAEEKTDIPEASPVIDNNQADTEAEAVKPVVVEEGEGPQDRHLRNELVI